MGIVGLNKWISANFPGVMQSLQGSSKSGGSARAQARGGCVGAARDPYDHVLFDLNGIVHRACRKCPSEKKVMEDIVSELDSLLLLFPATTSVLIALDGVGPTAKLMEQRKRRIDKVLKDVRDAQALIPGSAENLRRLELCRMQAERGKAVPPSKKHKMKSTDSLQVTPGTMFMLRLRRVLEWYSVSRACGVAGVFASHVPIILVSAADVSGEGELKLLQHVHAVLRTPRLHDARLPSFLLVGPDADLLLLALASGTPRCDVLTMDAKGCHKLFTVQALCDVFLRQLSNPPPHDSSARLGGFHQLDFLVVSFLMGNDYIPKLRGAKLQHLWGTLARLLHGGEFRGQHLLLPSEGRVEINMRLLVALTGSSCVRVASASARVEAEEEADDSDDGESSEEKEQDGDDNGEGSCHHGPASSRGVDVESYLRTLAWCAYMYLSGSCPDYSVTYASRTAPTAAQLAAFATKKQQESGSAYRPSYEAPLLGGIVTSAPLSPDAFCLCLLPAAAAAYLPRPLQAIMLDPLHPLADIFRANQIWPHDLVRRVSETVSRLSLSAYTAEERACISPGLVTVVIPAKQGLPAVPLPLWLRGCRHSPLSASPPSPFGSGADIKAIGKVSVGQMQPDESGSSLARWLWCDDGVDACALRADQAAGPTADLNCGSPAFKQHAPAKRPATTRSSVIEPSAAFDFSPLSTALPHLSPQSRAASATPGVQSLHRPQPHASADVSFSSLLSGSAGARAGYGDENAGIDGREHATWRTAGSPRPTMSEEGVACAGGDVPCQALTTSFAHAAYAFLLNRPVPATSAATAVRLSAMGSALAHRIQAEKIKLQRCLQGYPLMFRVLDAEKPGFVCAYALVND